MVASAEIFHRTCENRECEKEFTTTDHRQIYCDRVCLDREKYLRRKDKKSGDSPQDKKQTLGRSDAVSPDLPQPDKIISFSDWQAALNENTKVLKEQNEISLRHAVAIEKQTAAIETLTEIIKQQDSLDDTMQLQILAAVESLKAGIPDPKDEKRGIDTDTKEDDYKPVPASERGYIEDDELPLIEVKKSDKVEDGNQNFLNSLMAFG